MGDCAQCDRDNRGDRVTRAREPGAVAESPAFTLDLSAKTQELRKKIKFFATASAASTLVAEGDRVKIKGTATDQSGGAATDTVKAKVTDCPGRGQKADCTGR